MTRGLPIHYPQLDMKEGENKVLSVCLLHFPGISRQYMSGFIKSLSWTQAAAARLF